MTSRERRRGGELGSSANARQESDDEPGRATRRTPLQGEAGSVRRRGVQSRRAKSVKWLPSQIRAPTTKTASGAFADDGKSLNRRGQAISQPRDLAVFSILNPAIRQRNPMLRPAVFFAAVIKSCRGGLQNRRFWLTVSIDNEIIASLGPREAANYRTGANRGRNSTLSIERERL